MSENQMNKIYIFEEICMLIPVASLPFLFFFFSRSSGEYSVHAEATMNEKKEKTAMRKNLTKKCIQNERAQKKNVRQKNENPHRFILYVVVVVRSIIQWNCIHIFRTVHEI